MADHVDPAPGAVELSLHGMGVGGEVAVRAHKDLCAHLPGEFQIKVLGESIFKFSIHLQLYPTDCHPTDCHFSQNFGKCLNYPVKIFLSNYV